MSADDPRFKPPTPTVKPEDLYPLLATNLLYTVLLPALSEQSSEAHPLSLTQPPQWTLLLEAWYQIYHCGAWFLLDRDDARDSAFVQRMAAWIQYLEVVTSESSYGGMGRDAHDHLLRRVKEVQTEVMHRQCVRWAKVLAFRRARKAYFAFFQASDSSVTVDTILSRSPAGDMTKLPPPGLKINSVWFLPIPFDPAILDPYSARLAPPIVDFSSSSFRLFGDVSRYSPPDISGSVTVVESQGEEDLARFAAATGAMGPTDQLEDEVGSGRDHSETQVTEGCSVAVSRWSTAAVRRAGC